VSLTLTQSEETLLVLVLEMLIQLVEMLQEQESRMLIHKEAMLKAQE